MNSCSLFECVCFTIWQMEHAQGLLNWWAFLPCAQLKMNFSHLRETQYYHKSILIWATSLLLICPLPQSMCIWVKANQHLSIATRCTGKRKYLSSKSVTFSAPTVKYWWNARNAHFNTRYLIYLMCALRKMLMFMNRKSSHFHTAPRNAQNLDTTNSRRSTMISFSSFGPSDSRVDTWSHLLHFVGLFTALNVHSSHKWCIPIINGAF